MNKYHFFLYVLLSTLCLFLEPLQASLFCGCEPLDLTAEVRVAYYSPSSHKVRRIYGDGWADYQLEISKGIAFGWRAWAGVSGFSRKGDSIGFHDRTRLTLIPINFGVKYDYNLAPNLNIFVGGAACYSFLRIHDNSDYVHKHTRKEDWGGIVQSGISYRVYDWIIVSAFADYFFQEFHFHNSHRHGGASGDSHYGYVERSSLNMNGYKIGVGLGAAF